MQTWRTVSSLGGRRFPLYETLSALANKTTDGETMLGKTKKPALNVLKQIKVPTLIYPCVKSSAKIQVTNRYESRNSYRICLPFWWVKFHNTEYINFYYGKDGSLILRPAKRVTK